MTKLIISKPAPGRKVEKFKKNERISIKRSEKMQKNIDYTGGGI